jgi:hypothetical protein
MTLRPSSKHVHFSALAIAAVLLSSEVAEMGRELASSNHWPQWKPGSEFKAVRDQSAAARQ